MDFFTVFEELKNTYGVYVMWAILVYLGMTLRDISEEYKDYECMSFIFPILVVCAFTQNAVAVLLAVALRYIGTENKLFHLLSFCVCVPFLCTPKLGAMLIVYIPLIIVALCQVPFCIKTLISLFSKKGVLQP